MTYKFVVRMKDIFDIAFSFLYIFFISMDFYLYLKTQPDRDQIDIIALLVLFTRQGIFKFELSIFNFDVPI